MLRRVLILFAISSVVAIALLVVALYPPIENRTRYAHTSFLFGQIQEVLSPGQLPSTKSELISILKAHPIDWNSCRIDDSQVLDGWGQPIAMTWSADGSVLTLTSAGIDGLFETADDVQAAILGTTNGEPRAANWSQPLRSETNRTSSAAGSRR
jgi:hypothetical protein